MKKSTKLLTFLVLMALPSLVFAFGEIEVRNLEVEMISPDQYKMVGQVYNRTRETREVTLRSQITFYDRTAPKGDKPVVILRKDFIQVLRPWETRDLDLRLLNEGTSPAGALRMEPMLRVRRQREWMY